MDANQFIEEKVREIKEIVGQEKALVALSGGVDSSTVTVLAHKAISNQLITVFIDNGLMRKDEGEWVQNTFKKLGIPVKIIDAQEEFLEELAGKEDPEAKRERIEWCFYGRAIPKICQEYGIKYWLQGTILTDIEETKAGIKLQHNVRPDLNPEKYGLPQGITPLKELRKNEVREVARALGLPKEISERLPFLGPGLAGRIVGEVTPEKLDLIRKAHQIVDEEAQVLSPQPFQIFPVLLNDQATGIREHKRAFGRIIIIRTVVSEDARTAKPYDLSLSFRDKLTERIVTEIPQIVRVAFEHTPKPPATIEFV